MELKGLYDAVLTLGLPSALAVFLIWHFVRLNLLLSKHNAQLVNELAKLRESIAKNPQRLTPITLGFSKPMSM